MEFEFDPAKSDANREKHGIDFVEAQELWAVDGWGQPSPFLTEPRLQRTALWKDRHWTAVYTLRGPRVRIISVRRARTDEVEDYERSRREVPRTDLEP
jgi:hypothetical protein